MSKKIFNLIVTFTVLLGMMPACSYLRGDPSHNGTIQTRVNSSDNPQVHTQARFRGGSGRVAPSPGGYHSGYRSPSPNVRNPNRATPGPAPGRAGGLFPFLGGLGAGALLGSLFHPFTGGFGGGFSILGLLIWALIFFGIYKLIRSFSAKAK
jgi:predicted lipid-binding transport protein (Tim44 family)